MDTETRTAGDKSWPPAGLHRFAASLSCQRKTKPQTPCQVDFGWRLHGKPIRVLPDSSLQLLARRQQAAAALLSTYYSGNGKSLVSCLQCGACTVNCQLAESDGALFPRRQITLLQLGEIDKLIADPHVWLCFNCDDCTSRCPAQAGPGRIMAAVRRLAVEKYSVPAWWSRLVNQPRGFVYAVLAAIVALVGAIAAGGSFSPRVSPVQYSTMLPHLTLNLLFGTLAGAVMIVAAVNATRVWKEFSGETFADVRLGRLVRSLRSVTRQVGAHNQFSECQQYPLSRSAHLAVFYGFMTLTVLAGGAALMIVLGVPYPLPVFHPFKIAGNLAAAAMIAGTLYFCVQRWSSSRKWYPSSWFDWAPLVQLLLVSTTGLLAEIFRYVNVGVLAYPTYFLHLVCVFVLFASLANSKLVHMVYRTIALTAEEYKKTSEEWLAEPQPERAAA